MSPRNVRNFWLTLAVDGRSTIDTGPQAAGGGFKLTILMREKGEVSEHRVTVEGRVVNGELILDASTDAKVDQKFRESYSDGTAFRVRSQR